MEIPMLSNEGNSKSIGENQRQPSSFPSLLGEGPALQKQNCYYNKKMFVSWDSLQEQTKFCPNSNFFPQIDSCLCYFEYFLCEITLFFGLFDQFILCYLRFITKTNLIC